MVFREKLTSELKNIVEQYKTVLEFDRCLRKVNKEELKVKLQVGTDSSGLWEFDVDVTGDRIHMSDITGTLGIVTLPHEKADVMFYNRLGEVEAVYSLLPGGRLSAA